MAHTKTVFDFMRSMPAALRHEEMYYEHRKSTADGSNEVDMGLWEETTIGVGERNLLADVPTLDKFRVTGMDKGFVLRCGALAKQKGKEFGVGSIKHSSEYMLDFRMDKKVVLTSQGGSVLVCSRPGLEVPENEPLYRQIHAALEGASGLSFCGPAVSYVGEKVVARADLRHLFLKGYLMLMQYNLAVVSDSPTYTYRDFSADVKTDCDGEMKLSCLTTYRIVVDVAHLTDDEVYLLAEMASQYPTRRYGEKNIYNNLEVSADLLVLCTPEKDFSFKKKHAFGSPDRLWRELVNLAVKMDALDDLREVIRDFRGVPELLRSVSVSTGRRSFELAYPKSYSLRMGIESMAKRYVEPVEAGGYYATSKNLVVDLLVGRLLLASTYNLIEEFGGLGDICVPSCDVIQDPLFNSVLRNLGLKMEDNVNNALLREWLGVKGCPIPIGFGGKLKDYVQKFANSLRAGTGTGFMPQLLHTLPFSEYHNTTWGTIRGWRFQAFEFRDRMDDRVMQNVKLKAFTWVMGIGSTLPKIGLNGLGSRQVDVLTPVEMEHIALAAGEYELGLVRYTLNEVMMPRVDEDELTMTGFYQTRYPGARCTIVFDKTGGPEIVQSDTFSYQLGSIGRVSSDMYGDRAVTVGGSKMNQVPHLVSPGPDEGPGAAYMGQMKYNKGNSNVNLGFEGDEIEVLDAESLSDEAKKKIGYDGKAVKEVKINPRGRVVVHKKAAIRLEDGRPVASKVKTMEGKEVEVMGGSWLGKLKPTNFRGEILQTPGDGTCGIHALVQDLLLKGFISDSDPAKVHDNLMKHVGSEKFHSVHELSALTNCLGMGFILIDDENKRIMECGTGGEMNNVCVYYKDGHYSTFIPRDDGSFHGEGFRHEEGATEPWAGYKATLDGQEVLESDFIVNVSQPKCFETLRKSITGAAGEKYADAIPKKKVPCSNLPGGGSRNDAAVPKGKAPSNSRPPPPHQASRPPPARGSSYRGGQTSWGRGGRYGWSSGYDQGRGRGGVPNRGRGRNDFGPPVYHSTPRWSDSEPPVIEPVVPENANESGKPVGGDGGGILVNTEDRTTVSGDNIKRGFTAWV